MPMTRSLVDNLTTQAMEANFLRIDEDVESDKNGLYTYDAESDEYEGKINWEKAKIIEASVISSPDREGRRSVYLNPVQGYPMYVQTIDDVKISTYYHTRLVSWYPRTCELVKDSETGMATDYIFDVYNSSMSGSGNSKYEAEDGVVKIRFTGLNGEQDIMVSDVVEAQHWHDDADDDVICGSDEDTYGGKGLHRQPLGHNDSDPTYENLMTYKHYMSAVRVNAYPKDQSDQVIGLWGKIRKVVVVNQPTECLVSLPTSVESASGKSGFGTAEFSNDKLGSFDLVRTSMFGDDANNDYHYIADDESTLEKFTSSNPMKLGYALIAPETELILDVHTDAGVYRVSVPASKEVTGVNGETEKIQLFESGKIYDVLLEFQTSNTIAALILSDDGYKYFDLTVGKIYDPAYGSDYYDYKYSNCYVIYPEIAGENIIDGFCFNATVAGNGEDGILSGFDRTTASIDPVNVGLIWESSYGLIQQVELLFGYVRFRVPDYETKQGNAVIGVFDEYGNVLWSWHIWITDSAPSAISYSLGMVDVGVMDRNLGAFSAAYPNDAESALNSYGLYYQWGRKDPSMGPPVYNYRPMSTATAEYYDGYGNDQQSTGVINIPRPTISDGVDNPMYLILPTEWSSYYQYDWLYDRVDNLWGGGAFNTKTIYDPCPEGYVVPNDELNLLLSNASVTSSTYGLQAYDKNGTLVFFPYAGYKGVDRGMSSLTCSWKYVGTKGDYMSAKTLTSNHRSRTYVSSSKSWTETGADGGSAHYNGQHYYIDGANRRTAGSIRCVKDQGGLGSVQVNMSVDQFYYFDGEFVNGSFEYFTEDLTVGAFTLEYAYGKNSSDDALTWTEITYDVETGTFQHQVKCQENSHLFFRLSADIPSLGDDVKFTKIYSTDVYAYYNDEFNHEGDNLLVDKYYILTLKDDDLRLCISDDGEKAEVKSNDASSEFGMYDHILYLEDIQLSSEKPNYRNVATCKIKHYMSGKYLQRVSGDAGGVQLTDKAEDATLFYLCSDWHTDSSVTQTTVDILDEDGHYLFVTNSKDVSFNASYSGNSYKWYINRVKNPVATAKIAFDKSSYAVGGGVTGMYTASVEGYDISSVSVQYALSDDYAAPLEDEWVDSGLNLGSSVNEAFSLSDLTTEYVNDLWVRLKVTIGEDFFYSVADKSLLFPNTTHTASDIFSNSKGRYYLFTFRNNRDKYLSVNSNGYAEVSSLASGVSSIKDLYANSSAHIFIIDSFEFLEQTGNVGYTDGTYYYYNIGKGLLKHYATGKYLYFDGTDDNTPLYLVDSSDDVIATSFQFSSSWANNGDGSTVDIIYANNTYLYTDGDYLNLWLNTKWNSNNYQWILYPIPAPALE